MTILGLSAWISEYLRENPEAGDMEVRFKETHGRLVVVETLQIWTTLDREKKRALVLLGEAQE